MRKVLGYFLLLVSCLAFAVLPVIPFLDLAVAEKASWATATFIFAEISWWLAMPLLGPEVMAFCRRYWQKLNSRRRLPAQAQQPLSED